MTAAGSLVLSASRRTDLPAFYMPWMMRRLATGTVTVVNPYNRKSRRVAVDPDTVHSIVFWSKNYGPFLDGRYGEALDRLGYGLFFHFTVNSADPLLEPGLPPLSQRLAQAGALARRFGPHRLQWRFDPICHYRRPDGVAVDNLTDFDRIAEQMAAIGVGSCTTSFIDLYAKVRRRAVAGPCPIEWTDLPTARKRRVLAGLAGRLAGTGIRLETCCEGTLYDPLPPAPGIRPAACIDHGRLMAVNGGRLDRRRDRGQRTRLGCGCQVAVDIGDYRRHLCRHGCRYCYAN
jgi:hypothetical protein